MGLCFLFMTYADHVILSSGGDLITSSNGMAVTSDSLSMTFTTMPWTDSTPPDPSHPLVQKLARIHGIWSYLQGLATFILTFYLQQAYTFWRRVYNQGRAIQGRLNDYELTVATNCKRKSDGSMIPEAKDLMEDVGQFSRLFHILMWASTAERFKILQTPQGLRRMTSRGILTSRQLQTLENLRVKLELPETKLFYAPLEWMMIRINKAMDDGCLSNDTATKSRLIQFITKLRASHATILDELDARMPLA